MTVGFVAEGRDPILSHSLYRSLRIGANIFSFHPQTSVCKSSGPGGAFPILSVGSLSSPLLLFNQLDSPGHQPSFYFWGSRWTDLAFLSRLACGLDVLELMKVS